MMHAATSGCVLQSPFQKRLSGAVGGFGFRDPDRGYAGMVIGVPHGRAEPAAVDLAQAIRAVTGAGLVIAYDFKNKRIPVAQPLIQSHPIAWSTVNSSQPSSVYPEFQKLLQSTALGPLNFYVGVRLSEDRTALPRIEVATSGFAFGQLKSFKELYAEMRDRRLQHRDDVPSVDLALNPLDDVNWNSHGVRHHGVLMLAKRGLVLRVPKILASSPLKAIYSEIVTDWIQGVRQSLDDSSPVQTMNVEPMTYGRIDRILTGNRFPGVVLAAPHGTSDWQTAELVEEMSDRTAVAAVVTRGFSPTQCAGWRINVNRPTERRYSPDTIERKTNRAAKVYQRFQEAVLQAAGGHLNTYMEMHQNGSEPDIAVATLGISRDAASEIKNAYREIRDRILNEFMDVPKINLLIEPLDQVAIGAWAAKDHGMLRLAHHSLHFELPAQMISYRRETRRTYTKILSELVERIAKSRGRVVPAKAVLSRFPSSSD